MHRTLAEGRTRHCHRRDGQVLGPDALGKVADRCLQLFGGYGYMDEYPISRIYRDARVMRIYAGTNEIMKLVIARSL
jgi:alkylation response protein AidB-like acyl-CoA dehydrogenase